jgi:hypothetical protein
MTSFLREGCPRRAGSRCPMATDQTFGDEFSPVAILGRAPVALLVGRGDAIASISLE